MLQPVDLEGVERILVVMAHPDDVDFSIAGSVAAWTDAGMIVTYCIVTDGDAGGAELGIPRSEMAGIRRDEQRALARKTERRQQIVRGSVRKLMNEVRGGRGHDNRVGTARDRDVPHCIVGAGLPQVMKYRASR